MTSGDFPELGTFLRKGEATMKGRGFRIMGMALAAMLAATIGAGDVFAAVTCPYTVTADVVVFDTPVMFNRLGAQNPNWITYALKRDVVAIEGTIPGPGNAQMRQEKRVRPMVLRVNEGGCLQGNCTNSVDSGGD